LFVRRGARRHPFFFCRRGKAILRCYYKKLLLGEPSIIGATYQLKPMDLAPSEIGELLNRQDEKAFEIVFKTYFKALHAYACSMLKDPDDAEERVQQVFFKLWERAGKLNIGDSPAAYLYRAVHNECLNFLKHQKVKSAHQLQVAWRMQEDHQPAVNKLMGKELEIRIREALNDLPEQCRTIFQMSRFESLKYREIADQLGLSVKTVENQMGKALRILREKLVDYLILIISLSILN